MDKNNFDDMEFVDVSGDSNEGETTEEKTQDTDTSSKDVTKEDDYDKESEYEDVCFICRRPESKAGRMFKQPNHLSVC